MSQADIDHQVKLQQEAAAMEKADSERRKAIWDHKPIFAAPLNAPPSTLRVGPYLYRVRYTSREALLSQNGLALTDLAAREIWLNRKRDLRVDVVHELMHAAADVATSGGWLSSNNYNDLEENVIHETAPVLLEVLRDNPELTRWLTQ